VLWDKFCADDRLPPALFGLCASFARPPPPGSRGSKLMWRHRGLLMEALFYSLTDSAKENDDLLRNCLDWLALAEGLLGAAPPASIQISLSRAAFTLCLKLQASAGKLGAGDIKEQAAVRFAAFFEILFTLRSVMIRPAIACGFQHKLLQRQTVLHCVATSGVHSAEDIKLVRECAEPKTACEAIRVLSAAPRIFQRLAFFTIGELLQHFAGRPDVKDIVVGIVRRCFVFSVLAFERNKYTGRAMLYLEHMTRLNALRIPWLSGQIQTTAWTLSSRAAPYLR
jgi:hypothetical protein